MVPNEQTPLINTQRKSRNPQFESRVIPEKSESLNYFSLKRRYIRFFMRSYQSTTKSSCDFDSEMEFGECEDYPYPLSNLDDIHAAAKREDELAHMDDEDDDDEDEE